MRALETANERSGAYLSQLQESLLIHTIFFEIRLRGLNDFVDDLFEDATLETKSATQDVSLKPRAHLTATMLDILESICRRREASKIRR